MLPGMLFQNSIGYHSYCKNLPLKLKILEETQEIMPQVFWGSIFFEIQNEQGCENLTIKQFQWYYQVKQWVCN